ncbi:hypothetical protein SLE2022_385000 [Rubroshorea leprosula]
MLMQLEVLMILMIGLTMCNPTSQYMLQGELQFNIIHDEPFIVHDLKFTPVPVWHGRDCHSLGFHFGNICYISDVSEIPEETYPLLEDCELLIMMP